MRRSTTLRTRFGRIFTPLNERERAVMLLTADGANNREIAAELNYTYGSIKNLRDLIYQKLNVPNRIAAINVAVLLGEIPCPHCQRRHIFSRRSVEAVKQMRRGRYVRTIPHPPRSEA